MQEGRGGAEKSVQLLIDTGEMARVGGWELDLSTKEVSWTEEVGRIHGVEAGYKPKLEEALNFYAPESRPGIEAAVKKVAETGEPYDLESLLIPRGSQDKIWVRSLGRPVYSGGKIVKLAGTFQNIDKYKKAEEEYKTVLLTAMDGFTIDDMQGRILYVNDAYCRLMGYTRDELLTMRISDIEAVERQEETAQHLKKIMEVGGDHFETHYRCKDGRIVDVEISANYIDTGGGRLFVFVRDITERRQAEVALRQTVENFRRSLDESPLGVCIVTKEGELIYVNQAMLDFDGGDSIEEFKKTPLNQRYTPESFAESRIRREKRKREDHGPSEYDISIVTKDGKIRHLHVFRKNIVWDGERQFLVLYNDVTERKQAEAQIHASLREKEILLSEIHHRVKNNMQVISSLLDLQAKSSGNQALAEMLNESQRRIRSMSMIHEQLYDSKDFARIDLVGYVRALSQELFQLYKINPGRIDMIVQTDGDVYVDINKAIPCGLILNELISNVLKHAFPGGEHGEILIIIRETKDTEIEILLRDNGLGMPDDVDIHNPQTVGLYLVNGLVKNQLDGQIEVRRDNGTEFRIIFPL